MEVSVKRADEVEGVAARQKEKLCEPCRAEDVTTHAKGLCRECNEFMCNTCFRHHLKARQCRNHALVDASRSPDRGSETFAKCAHHENEAIKYYCRKHEIVGCGDCMVHGHGACKPEFIKDLSKNFQENERFKNLVRKLETLTSANQEIGEAIQNNNKELRKVYEKALREITKFRSDINTFLDKAEADVKAEITRLKSDNENLLTELEKERKLLSSSIDKVKQKINAEIYHGNSLFIHTVEMTPEILNIERELARIQSENHIINSEFIPDKQLLDIVASGIKFGHIQNKVDQTGGREEAFGKKKVARLKSESVGASERSLQENESKTLKRLEEYIRLPKEKKRKREEEEEDALKMARHAQLQSEKDKQRDAEKIKAERENERRREQERRRRQAMSNQIDMNEMSMQMAKFEDGL